MEAININRIRVAVVTDRNDLAIPLSENLIKHQCNVDLVTNDIWSSEINLFQKNKYLSTVKASEINRGQKYRYTVFIKLFQGIEKGKRRINDEEIFNRAFDIASRFSSKILLIFPIRQATENIEVINSLKEKYFEGASIPTAILYVGDLAGSLMDTNRTDIYSLLIKDAVIDKVIRFPQGLTNFYPIEIKKAANEIVKNLFSFGVYGKVAAIENNKVKPKELADILRIKYSSVQIKKRKRINIFQKVSVDEKIIISGNVKRVVTQSYNKFKKEKGLPSKVLKEKKKKKYSNRTKNYLIRFFLIIIFSILLPVITLILSTTSFCQESGMINSSR